MCVQFAAKTIAEGGVIFADSVSGKSDTRNGKRRPDDVFHSFSAHHTQNSHTKPITHINHTQLYSKAVQFSRRTCALHTPDIQSNPTKSNTIVYITHIFLISSERREIERERERYRETFYMSCTHAVNIYKINLVQGVRSNEREEVA